MTALANESQRITTALLLAAGIGRRLQPLTDDAPKCLTKVNGRTILERLVEGLRASGIERLINRWKPRLLAIPTLALTLIAISNSLVVISYA